MLRNQKAFVCSGCDICQQEKPANLMCTYILEGHDASTAEEACWCVCQDCLPIVEHVDNYFEDFVK